MELGRQAEDKTGPLSRFIAMQSNTLVALPGFIRQQPVLQRNALRPMRTAKPVDILLVDDSRANVKLFELALAANRSTAVLGVARDGEEVLSLLLGSPQSGQPARLAQLPQLVMLDLRMPRFGGFDVLERLRANERTRSLPVIIYSASGTDEDQREAMRLGATDYWVKPADFSEICAVVATLERTWLSTASRATR